MRTAGRRRIVLSFRRVVHRHPGDEAAVARADERSPGVRHPAWQCRADLAGDQNALMPVMAVKRMAEHGKHENLSTKSETNPKAAKGEGFQTFPFRAFEFVSCF